ncbi:MAG: response regulator [Elusimicrobia bacterium]|nr:response regulator [Elusimicrobiota bacterium]
MMIKILIIDDDKNFIDTLEDSFKMKDVNAEIMVAKSAKEGLKALSKSIPSIIVLDVQLPDMHGIEFLKIIKESRKFKNIPVIFISAKYTEPSDRADAMLNGASSFFSKPVDIDVLWTEIKYLLDKKE